MFYKGSMHFDGETIQDYILNEILKSHSQGQELFALIPNLWSYINYMGY